LSFYSIIGASVLYNRTMEQGRYQMQLLKMSFYLLYCIFLVPKICGSDAEDGLMGVSAQQTTCEKFCQHLLQKFQHYDIDDRSGWHIRHESILKAFNDRRCESVVEVGVAYGGLTRYLLTKSKIIKEYHGIDPFLGGYDKTDEMSNVIKATNNSLGYYQHILNR